MSQIYKNSDLDGASLPMSNRPSANSNLLRMCEAKDHDSISEHSPSSLLKI
jgi:hypothetical protein